MDEDINSIKEKIMLKKLYEEAKKFYNDVENMRVYKNWKKNKKGKKE